MKIRERAMIVFAAMAAVLSTLAAFTYISSKVVVSVTTEDTVPEAPRSVLPKTIFSSSLRLSLAVGVEGTGHKYLLAVNRDLYEKNGNLTRLADIGMTKYHVRSAMGGKAQHYNTSREQAGLEMRDLAMRGADLPFPGAVMYIRGKYSYPDGRGPSKVMMYIDLRLLAEVAEAEGVDFRVLYLRRPVKDLIVADTVHRQFQDQLGNAETTTPEERYMEYMQIMLTDIAVMHSFLVELDPAFVICQEFERIGEVEQSTSIANFLAPNADIAGPLKTSLIEMAHGSGASNEALPYEGADLVAARLQRKFDVFEFDLCNDVHEMDG